MKQWKFYGRGTELAQLNQILTRNRFAFVKVAGRRRIGKTTLIRQVIQSNREKQAFYVQIPNASPAGVLSEIHGFMETMQLNRKKPESFNEFGQLIRQLLLDGFIVILDEFQYFHKPQLQSFGSTLQSVVDECLSAPESYKGCLIVLGSIQSEMNALLEDRKAPLYQRTTDNIDLTHLDISSVKLLLSEHGSGKPEELLFYWTLFEGVPKFYRDCFEQSAFGVSREKVLQRMFFESSSPLRNEAENWFLQELHGQYTLALRFIAANPGCSNGDIVQAMTSPENGEKQKVGAYLNTLVQRYQMVEKRLPIFSKENARSGRYYISDNFLSSWLYALKQPVASVQFRAIQDLLAISNQKLNECEGHALEKLVSRVYEERSKKGLPGFKLTKRIEGFWNRSDLEIDLIALNQDEEVIRFCTCKRSASQLTPSHLAKFKIYTDKFLQLKTQFSNWTLEFSAITTSHTPSSENTCIRHGFLAEDLNGLTADL